MSTSLLYHAFGIRGYQYVRSEYDGGRVTFTIHQRETDLCCPACRSRDVVRKGCVERHFSAVPIGAKPVDIVLPVQRVLCLDCGTIRQVEIGFADPRRSYTRQFERYALDLCRFMTIKDVALHLRVSWDVVKDIQKRYLTRRFGRPKLKNLSRIAIDEICIGKGHQYLTVVLDLRTGVVVFVGDGKGAEALEPFWRRLRASRAKIQAVAIDMSPAYISAVRQNLPEAALVFDHFHWIWRAGTSGVDMLFRFARTLAVHMKGILAYYNHRISTGPLEGTNNKINTMKRQAYGFRGHEFFKLKIMGLHTTRYALVG